MTTDKGLLARFLYEQLPQWFASQQQARQQAAAAKAAKAAAVDVAQAAFWAQCKADNKASYERWQTREQQRQQLKAAVLKRRNKQATKP